MIAYRCLAWNATARESEPDGALFFPRAFQGRGRHDNPDLYGCLYASEEEGAAVAEQLAYFRGQELVPAMLVQRGLPLALASIELRADLELVDLDDPQELLIRELRPSLVATRRRDITQGQALEIFREGAPGIRWWSTLESLWANVTLFDRAAPALRVVDLRVLQPDDEIVLEVAGVLGLRV